jgi:hypothetical protein
MNTLLLHIGSPGGAAQQGFGTEQFHLITLRCVPAINALAPAAADA